MTRTSEDREFHRLMFLFNITSYLQYVSNYEDGLYADSSRNSLIGYLVSLAGPKEERLETPIKAIEHLVSLLGKYPRRPG
ncbi:MAG: hypothetical protein ISS48_01260 [Candidatus Aenigmarchaeota archaeon]|nr:hypothetical protein [Candidatus Aenigmarchaeota archaeon]